MKFRPLEKVRTILQTAIGLDIMYAYDDLVFTEHGVFLFQFDNENEQQIICYSHEDFDPQERANQLQKLKEAFSNFD